MTNNTTSFAASLTSTAQQRNRRYRNEGNVKLDLSQLIEALGYGPVENEYTILGGSIDIYIPHHRVIIETKARGLANDPHKPQAGDRESPKEQLDRYVLSEIRKELGSFEWDPENRSRHPWIGIVTDGCAWHVWRYPHAHDPEIETIPSTTADSAAVLIGAVTKAFGRERVGKQWVPAAPADLFRDHATALDELYHQQPRDVRGRTETKLRLWLDMLKVSGIAPHDNNADRALVTRCAGLRPGPLDTPIASGKHTLRSLARRWLALAGEIATHDRHLERLTAETAPTLREGFAVGATTAAAMLIIFGDNPERIRSEAAFAKLCGACPIPASSGMTTGRHRLYRGGHRQANAALHRAVVVRMRYHQPTLDYVRRRTAEGRTKRDIIRCLKRFLAREIYQRVMTDVRERDQVMEAT